MLMTYALWVFAIIGYLGIGTVASAIWKIKDKEEFTMPITFTLCWGPFVVVVVWVLGLAVVSSLIFYPFRWLYITLAQQPVTIPFFIWEMPEPIVAPVAVAITAQVESDGTALAVTHNNLDVGM